MVLVCFHKNYESNIGFYAAPRCDSHMPMTLQGHLDEMLQQNSVPGAVTTLLQTFSSLFFFSITRAVLCCL